MVENGRLIGGTVGTCISAIAIDVNNLQSIESIVGIVCTTLGAIVTIISAIVIPLIRWYKEAKKDGKITADEVEKAATIVKDGTEEVKKNLENKDKEDK